ncbi:minor capsid protein [Lysinibacillus sp. KU-BSD001]|uniref:minor capsid protein n=1 Tax=Lysinibacillus sp. KU-BSD001 TaxID=3141328 RepID=UPI0036E3C862
MAKKTVPPTRFPDAVAVSYSRAIRQLVREMGKETLSIYDSLIKNEIIIYSRADSRGFVMDGPFDVIKNALGRIKSAAANAFSKRRVNTLVSSFVKNLNQVNKKNMQQQGRVRGIDPTQGENWLDTFMQEAVEKNVGYITNIHDTFTEKIEDIILNGVKNGDGYKQIRKQLVEQVGMSHRRAQFIAVDQSGTLFGQMTAKRHQNMGVNRFKWRTSKDERVRDSHKILENKIFSYDDPPKVGLPGEDFHCRCIALPVFDDDDE